MTRAWEKEKAYSDRRVAEITAELEQAIETEDQIRFQEAYQKAFRYMKKKDRAALYQRFMEKIARR